MRRAAAVAANTYILYDKSSVLLSISLRCRHELHGREADHGGHGKPRDERQRGIVTAGGARGLWYVRAGVRSRGC